MKLDYFVKDNVGNDQYLFSVNGELPTIGQYVYVNDERIKNNNFPLGEKNKYEIIRIDHSIRILKKLFNELSPDIKNHIIEEDFSLQEEENLIGGHVFKIDFAGKRIEYAKGVAQIILKKV